MSRIVEIQNIENKGSYALVHVLTDKQDEAVVYVGGAVEIFHDDKYDKTKAFVKKVKENNNA